MTGQTESPLSMLQRLVNGFFASQALHVAAVLNIADLLALGPRSVEHLARETNTHELSLYRLLRALASLGVFTEQENRCFALAPMGECLRSDAMPSLAPWAALIGRREFWQSWGNLLHSVRTGDNAFRHLFGVGVWEYRSEHPEAQRVFDRAMSGNSRRTAEAAVMAYDFSSFNTVVDVGGGQGALLEALLIQNPALSGILLDRPSVVLGARSLLEAKGLLHRCNILEGDFFKAIPGGADVYILQQILHDWEDPEATAILLNCRKAMRPDSVLLVIERLLAPVNQGAEGKLSDLNMLVMPGGRERTREEYSSLFRAAGLKFSTAVPTVAEFCVIEALVA